ncbi:fatty acid desaturase [Aeromicrobium sp. Root495]|uniref:fatty acid desaturase family protein n=1 Tax=Aeromicrobium sp. Root495 TaxID=1736550 RepID=UPI0006FFCAAA|nr:fatty acid desaturase [Aeromicrobium sp. Root495]KQY59310.1 fatty acid desaturase [Aeromicrobium sp. Root495]
MAYADVREYTHLTDEEVEEIGRELDAIRAEVEASRGQADRDYVLRIITLQRRLAAAGRITLFASLFPPAWLLGTALLSSAKILENMEIGHNTMHGQWDWMNDPEIHSSNWEWDTTQPAEQWKHSHNYIHHQFTNVLGHDNDVGYGILRMSRDQKWTPYNLGQPVYNALLAMFFEWGVALHDLDIESIRKGEKDPKLLKKQLKQIGDKVGKQALKDYIVYPALTGPAFVSTLTANFTSNIVRNFWAYMIIFCGHFPDGAVHFSEEELEDETRAEWYLRQMLGSANFEGGKLLHVMSGQLGYQIEHHLFPDLPSNRYADISVKVKDLCQRYGIPYTTGPLHKQYGQVLRTVMKLSLPNRRTKDNPAPPSARERRLRDDERPGRRSELGRWTNTAPVG